MNTKLHVAMLALGTTLLAACGGISVDDIVDQTPTGKMAGASWTMKSAVVTDSGSDLSISLYPIEVMACDRSAQSDTQILFSVPKQTGERPLKLELTDLAGSQTVTFVPGPGQNMVASEGILNIESLSAEKVTIGILAEFDDSHTINGRFTADICSSSQ